MAEARPYPAPIDDGAAAHLVPGLAVPAVALVSTAGGEVRLAAHAGLAVVFIYPWTGRPGHANPPHWDSIPGAHGSTPEAEGFHALHPDFRALGADIFGLSSQDTTHQRELVHRLALPFALLSDRDFEMQKALSLPTFNTGAIYLKRLTLVIRGGRIVRTFYPVHPPNTHASEVLAWLSSA